MRGFTFVEMLFVVTIIIFISAIAIAGYGRFQSQQTVYSDTALISQTLRQYQNFALNGIGYGSTGITNGGYVLQITNASQWQVCALAGLANISCSDSGAIPLETYVLSQDNIIPAANGIIINGTTNVAPPLYIVFRPNAKEFQIYSGGTLRNSAKITVFWGPQDTGSPVCSVGYACSTIEINSAGLVQTGP